ncbi:185_t:CDS:10, partial [Acaulospora colombiana]
ESATNVENSVQSKRCQEIGSSKVKESRDSPNAIESVDLTEDATASPNSLSNDNSLHLSLQPNSSPSRAFVEPRSTPSWDAMSRSNISSNLCCQSVNQKSGDVQTDGNEQTMMEVDEIEDGNIEKVIMAVNHRKRRLGCAYYNCFTSTLYLMEDMEESPPYDIVNLHDTSTVQLEVEIRPGSEFVYASAKTRLCSIRLGSRQSETSKQETYLQLSSIVNMESVETVCCAGALINYISRVKAGASELQDSQQLMEVLGVEQFSLFRTIECFLQPDNLDISNQLISSLKHVKNIPKIIEKIKGKLNVKDWQSLLQFAFYCLKILNLIKELRFRDDIEIFSRIKDTFIVTDLKDIGSYINDVIDFDESVKENRIVVKPHVDEELDHMKRTYDGLDDFLSEVAREISTIIPSEFASTLNVIYFPQLGYLITVPLKPEWTVEQDFQIDDRELEIVQKLQDRALEYVSLLLTASAVCSELDW